MCDPECVAVSLLLARFSRVDGVGPFGLRAALFRAATVMLNRGRASWLTAWAWNVAKSRGKKRATVGLARRIGVVLHRMWRDGTEFRFTRADAMAVAAV